MVDSVSVKSEVEMMDTPEKTQISSSLSKFEDSPVFNYINNLSPIKPVKSAHHMQTFTPLSSASLLSIFTSPHVSSNKETKFLKRHSYTDPSEEESKVSRSEESDVEAGQPCDSSSELPENFDTGVSLDEASLEFPDEPSRFAIELPRTLKYDCDNPNCDPAPHIIEMNCASASASTSLSIVSFVQQASENGFPDGGMEDQYFVPGTIFCPIPINELPQTSVDCDELKDPSLQTGEIGELSEINHAHGNFKNNGVTNCTSGYLADNAETGTGMSASFSSKSGSNLHRGFRRRCLDFEMLAARKKNLDDGSNTSSSVDHQLVSVKPGNDSSLCIVPGVGLHLNALAITSRDNKNTKHKILSSGIRKLSFLRSTTSILPSTAGRESVHESLTPASTESDTDPAETGVQLREDVSQSSAYVVNEELNQYSPKKKRRGLEQAEENESCKRCNCKKSKCLKLYCECFAAGVYCIEPCSCQDCFNKPIHEDTVLATRKQIESRNPLAFAPKVISVSDSIPDVVDDSSKTPASARHKRGCNCKKSSCLKKYCECYQGGVGCSDNCRCEGCKNVFGRKDGSAIVETEGSPVEDEETDPSGKIGVDKNLEKTDIFNNEDRIPVSAIETTPLQLCRPLVQVAFSSKSKPPRSFISIGSSSTLYNGKIYGKPSIIRPRNMIEKHFQSVAEDEMPEMLLDNYSSGIGIKTSPNSKRISPPQEATPGRRSGRKLILRSIPSFPSLTRQ